MHIMDTAQLKNDCYRSYVLKEALQDPYVKKKRQGLKLGAQSKKDFMYVYVYIHSCVHTRM